MCVTATNGFSKKITKYQGQSVKNIIEIILKSSIFSFPFVTKFKIGVCRIYAPIRTNINTQPPINKNYLDIFFIVCVSFKDMHLEILERKILAEGPIVKLFAISSIFLA